MSTATWSLHNKTKRMGMAPKAAHIEGQLVKFEEEFLKQKEAARLKKEADDRRYQEAVQNFRQERLKNLKTNHEYMKEWDRNLNGLWKHSKVTIQEMKDVRTRFNASMTSSIRKAEDARSTQAREEFEMGVKHFEDNANRLGVELEHDSDRPERFERAPFNFQAMMQKVRAKSELNEISRKQKESRERYIALKQAKMREEVAKQATVKSKLERYARCSELHKADCEASFAREDKESFIAAQRESLRLERKAKDAAYMEGVIDNLKTMSDEDYKKRAKEIRFLKQVHMFKEREKEYNYHYHICAHVMDNVLRLMEVCYDRLPRDNDGHVTPTGQISTQSFKELLRRFTNQEILEDLPPEQAELQSTINTYSRLKDNVSTADVQSSKNNYLDSASTYKVPLTYGDLMHVRQPRDHTNPTLVKLMLDYIDLVHPMMPVPSFPHDSFNLVPVRISILGTSLAGKRTAAKRLSAILNVPVIDVDKLIDKAKSFVKQEENDDAADGDKKAAKKPAQTKPGAVKKDAGPVQLSDADLEFQKLGVKFRNMELLGNPISDELKIELIQLELKNTIRQQKLADIKVAFEEAKRNAETKRVQKAAAPTKDDKKIDRNKSNQKLVPKENNGGQAGEEVQEPTFEEKYPYTQGYILLNFPATVEQAQ